MSQIRRSVDERAKAEAKAAEKKRLAAALRANLKRRKLAAGDIVDTKAALPVESEAGTE